jgi:hypothetical protein
MSTKLRFQKRGGAVLAEKTVPKLKRTVRTCQRAGREKAAARTDHKEAIDTAGAKATPPPPSELRLIEISLE